MTGLELALVGGGIYLAGNGQKKTTDASGSFVGPPAPDLADGGGKKQPPSTGTTDTGTPAKTPAGNRGTEQPAPHTDNALAVSILLSHKKPLAQFQLTKEFLRAIKAHPSPNYSERETYVNAYCLAIAGVPPNADQLRKWVPLSNVQLDAEIREDFAILPSEAHRKAIGAEDQGRYNTVVVLFDKICHRFPSQDELIAVYNSRWQSQESLAKMVGEITSTKVNPDDFKTVSGFNWKDLIPRSGSSGASGTGGGKSGGGGGGGKSSGGGSSGGGGSDSGEEDTSAEEEDTSAEEEDTSAEEEDTSGDEGEGADDGGYADDSGGGE